MKLKCPDLLPLASRFRVRANYEAYDRDDLEKLLRHATAQAGNPKLIAGDLVPTLAERAMGNPRVLFALAADLLEAAVSRDAKLVDEKLFVDVFQPPPTARPKAETRARAR